MDNNNPIITQTPNTTPPVSPVPPAGANQPPTAPSSKKMIWLVLGLLVLVLIGGIYYFVSKGNKASQPIAEQVTANPTPQAQENLDQFLDSIDVQAADSDFTSIDSDLTNL